MEQTSQNPSYGSQESIYEKKIWTKMKTLFFRPFQNVIFFYYFSFFLRSK